MESHSRGVGRTEIALQPRAFSISRVLLGATLLWAPLPFGAVYTWAWASITFLTLVVLILWTVGCIRMRRLRIGFTPLYVPIILLLAFGLAQLIFHVTLTPLATKESLLKLATYSVLFFVVIQLTVDSSVDTWRRMGFAVLIFGFVFGFLSILQYFWNPGRIIWVGHDLAGPFGPYVDRDHYAGLMELVIPISSCYVLSRPKHDPLNGILWFGAIVPIISLLLTGSRGGFVSVAVEIAILGWVVIWRNPLADRRMKAGVTALALLAMASLFFWLSPDYTRNRLGTVNNYVPDTSEGNRPALWRSSLGILRDHPLVGAGLGSFVTVYSTHQTEAIDLVTEHAHNDYMEALTETGWLGGFLILTALGLFLPIVFGDLGLQLKREPGWIQLGAGVSSCGLLVHSFVDFNLHIPANATWFAFCVAIASLSGRSASERDETSGSDIVKARLQGV